VPTNDPHNLPEIGMKYALKCAKEAVESHKGFRSESLDNRFQTSVTHQLNEWRNEEWSDVQESLDSAGQSLLKLRKRVMRVPAPSPLLLVHGGLALSDSEKADSLSDSHEAQYERVNETLSSVFIEAVGDSMIGNEYVQQVNRN
jgi:hypothetical protein